MCTTQQTRGYALAAGPSTLTIRANLAETLRALGELGAARELHEQVFQAARAAAGRRAPQHADEQEQPRRNGSAQAEREALPPPKLDITIIERSDGSPVGLRHASWLA